jgi:hypothetical protein
MKTLKGDWYWIKTDGGLGGSTTINEFSSIIKILSQNKDASINYKVFVKDTLFYEGAFEIQYKEPLYGFDGKSIMTLPHHNSYKNEWFIHFGIDTLSFGDGAWDGYQYYYQKKIK